MDIDIDLQAVIEELLDKNKQLILENIILRKALEQIQGSNNTSYEEPEHHKVL